MLFGRAPAKEKIPLHELQAYLDRCFDAKLRRLSTRMPETEASLKRSFSSFEREVQKFSKSTASPDMEYLYGLKEAYLKSQMVNYSTSLLNLLSSPPEYGGSYLYSKGKEMLAAYSSFITNVMKVNNTFRLVMIGYAAGLSGVKHSFTEMERLCKELGNELNTCLPEEGEHNKIRSRVNTMLQGASDIAEARRSPEPEGKHTASDEGKVSEIQKLMEEKGRKCELARHAHREADFKLASLLLPVERVARKHDHMSAAKTKLTEYLKDPAERIRTPDDTAIIHRHLGEIAGEIGAGKIDAKNAAGLVSQIDAIRGKDLLSLADSSRRAAAELRDSEAELSELRLQLHALEKSKAEKQRMAEEKNRTEQGISAKMDRLSSEKKELEALFLSSYKKQMEIILPT